MAGWPDGTKLQVFSAVQLRELQGSLAPWESIVGTPTGFLKPNNKYGIVVYAQVGGFVASTNSSAANVCNVTLGFSPGSRLGTLARYDMKHGSFGRRFPLQSAGHPFQSVYIYDTPGTDSQIDLQVQVDAQGASTTVPVAQIGAASMIIFDLTALGSAKYRNAFNANTQTLTETASTRLLSTTGHGFSKVFFAFSVEAEFGLSKTAGVWGTGTNDFAEHIWPTHSAYKGLRQSYVGTRHRASTPARLARASHFLRFGDMRVVDDPGRDWTQPSIYGRDFESHNGLATANKVTRCDMLLVDIGEISERTLTQIDAPVQQSERIFGDAGQWLSRTVPAAIGVPHLAMAMQSVRAKQTNSATAIDQTVYPRALQEVDGASVNPNDTDRRVMELALNDRLECLPFHRVTPVHLDKGTHCLRIRGAQRGQRLGGANTAVFNALSFATMASVEGLLLLGGLSGPEPTEIVVYPRKEGPATESLPALPMEPVDVYDDVEDLRPIVDFESHTGYRHAWPRMLHPRKLYSIRWICNQPQLEALQNFVGLGPIDGRGVLFKWRPRDEPDEAAFAFVPDGDAFLDATELEGGTRKYEVRAKVVELVYQEAAV